VQNTMLSSLSHAVDGFATVSTAAGVELLGSAVSMHPSFKSAVAVKRVLKCVAAIQQMLKIPDPPICLLLLRSCLGMVKLNYTIQQDALAQASHMMSTCLFKALRVIVTDDKYDLKPFHLHLASLPIRLGGLGISLPSDILQFAALASQFDTLELQQNIFKSTPDSPFHLQIPATSLSSLCQSFLTIIQYPTFARTFGCICSRLFSK